MLRNQLSHVFSDETCQWTLPADVGMINSHELLFDPRNGRYPKGDNDRYIDGQEVVRILEELLRSATYQSIVETEQRSSSAEVVSYDNNATYWGAASNQELFDHKSVLLKDFWISEWAPLSPGQYFAKDARENRERARDYLNDGHAEYLPLGKNYMILGGVGSLRFAPKESRNRDVFVLGASSSGVTHEGVPLSCDRDIYKHIIQHLKQAGAVRCDIRGYIRHLPNELSDLQFSSEVERYCVHVTDLKIHRVAGANDILGTVQILFPSSYPTYRANASDEFYSPDSTHESRWATSRAST